MKFSDSQIESLKLYEIINLEKNKDFVKEFLHIINQNPNDREKAYNFLIDIKGKYLYINPLEINNLEQGKLRGKEFENLIRKMRIHIRAVISKLFKLFKLFEINKYF